MKPLREAIKNHYLESNLNPSQLQRLKRLQKKTAWPKWVAVGMTLTLACGLFWGQQRLKIQQLACSVAKQHLSIQPHEIRTASFGEVQSFFQLDFKLLEPQLPDLSQAKLIGARCCSLNGVITPQIFYQKGEQKITVYQIPKPTIFPFTGLQQVCDDTQVTVVRQGGNAFFVAYGSI